MSFFRATTLSLVLSVAAFGCGDDGDTSTDTTVGNTSTATGTAGDDTPATAGDDTPATDTAPATDSGSGDETPATDTGAGSTDTGAADSTGAESTGEEIDCNACQVAAAMGPCAAETGACQGDNDCGAALLCVLACTDQPCVGACVADLKGVAAELAGALLECANAECRGCGE